ncbi:MAG: proton-conducting transporter membrane subunit [Spirochaetia bacterium]|jgi:formate hydrogenlyase subunit 3/multisubunit Na+/H+ antiporter MnhD subunit|nr:proton-conducting transporter membrane subunit [Spirochaetia bacterium]
MVNLILINPIYIIGIGLGTAFLLGFFKKGKSVAWALMLAALAVMTYISFTWLWSFIFNGQLPEQVYTAGFKPPFSINLLMGKSEAFFTFLISFVGFLGGIYLFDKLKEQGTHAISVYLILIMGLNGIVMTRDIFNLFVFLEIASIATAGLIVLTPDIKAFSAGFKYMIASGLISGFLLIGIIFAYYFGGTLNIDFLIQADLLAVKGGVFAVFLIIIALLLELKPFPANGWGIDAYEASPAGINAVISAASAGAVYYVLSKVLPIADAKWYTVTAVVGMITFLGSNLMGIKQADAKRMLGYSSVGQVGLLLVFLGLSKQLGINFEFIVFGIIISHYLAKAGLFWLAGIVKTGKLKEWGILRRKPVLVFFMGTFIFALLGLPPFPSFFAKWTLVMTLSAAGMNLWVGLILLGSLVEAIYLFRWLGYTVKLDDNKELSLSTPLYKTIPVWVFGLLTYYIGYLSSTMVPGGSSLSMFYIPLAFVGVLFIVDKFLPVLIKNTVSIAAMAYYGWYYMADLTEFRMLFAIIFIGGGIITLIAGYAKNGKRIGFYPFAMMMYAGLAGLLLSENILQFFISWELMTLGSYILILRGKKSMPHALSYMLFSLGGAFLILAGLGLAYASSGANSISLDILKNVNQYSGLIYAFLAVGFMTKTAAIGLHIWLPGAHAEAESDVSPMVSAILLKAGMFGLVVLMLSMGSQSLGGVSLPYLLGWLGAITAILGNIMAVFQEDAKRLLAYSSVGQLGYVVFAMAFMSHLGWLTALAFALNHFVFKALLFLAIGGVVMRTKTKTMYEMGGLIKRMPFSFISVLIGIIALSGLPPLTGFAGKWLSYNAVIEKGWYFQGFLVSIAGLVAFLYCFRIIHVIFLGQPKDKFKNIKEAPLPMLIAQYILIGAIMLFSIMPNMVLKPVGDFLIQYFPDGALQWQGGTAISRLGRWSGVAIMNITMGIFGIIFVWLLFISRKAVKVKPFNIFYSGEAPSRPELTHFGYNFFAPYKKAVGFLVQPLVTRFWYGLADILHSISDLVRRLYNGNGQTYAFYVIIFMVVFSFFTIGG